MPEESEGIRIGVPTVNRQEASETFVELSEKLMCEMRQSHRPVGTTVPLVEDLLKNHGLNPENMEPEVLTDLVYSEWMLRLEQGESPSREEYFTRFPRIRHRLARQWTLDESLADIAAESIPGAVSETTSARLNAQPFGNHSIGKYRVISPLGSGGQADVYRAFDPALNRDVVIKLIRPRFQPDSTIEVSPSEVQMKSALAEGRLLAQLSHPHVAQIFDVDQVYGCPFLVMEYVQGHSLDQYLHLHRMNVKQIARLLAQIASAVAAAHERGILHRDIKPQNIVVSDEGQPKLIDFGLARISDLWETCDEHPGLCGTLAYLSPEQALGESGRINAATDIFALGAVLFFLLTGAPLYQGSSSITGVSLEGLLERAKRCDWDRTVLHNPEIPRGLAVICERALQPEPSARFASAGEFASALNRFANPPRAPLFIAATAMTVLVGTIAVFAWSGSKNKNDEGLVPQNRPASAINTVLKMVIHHEDARIDLLDAVPLKSGAVLHLEAEIPAGISFVLLSINGEGRMQEVAAFASKAENWQWRYPESEMHALPLTGLPGTECLMLFGTSDAEKFRRDSEAEALFSAWQENSEWPPVASTTVLRLRGLQVTVEQKARDLGVLQRSVPDSAEKVTMSLEKFAARFGSSYPLMEAIAFCHGDGE